MQKNRSGHEAGEKSGQKAWPKCAKNAKNAEKPLKTCRKMVHRRPENAEKWIWSKAWGESGQDLERQLGRNLGRKLGQNMQKKQKMQKNHLKHAEK